MNKTAFSRLLKQECQPSGGTWRYLTVIWFPGHRDQFSQRKWLLSMVDCMAYILLSHLPFPNSAFPRLLLQNLEAFPNPELATRDGRHKAKGSCTDSWIMGSGESQTRMNFSVLQTTHFHIPPWWQGDRSGLRRHLNVFRVHFCIAWLWQGDGSGPFPHCVANAAWWKWT